MLKGENDRGGTVKWCTDGSRGGNRSVPAASSAFCINVSRAQSIFQSAALLTYSESAMFAVVEKLESCSLFRRLFEACEVVLVADVRYCSLSEWQRLDLAHPANHMRASTLDATKYLTMRTSF